MALQPVKVVETMGMTARDGGGDGDGGVSFGSYWDKALQKFYQVRCQGCSCFFSLTLTDHIRQTVGSRMPPQLAT